MSEVIGSGQKANAVTLKDAFPDIELAGGVTIHKYLARIMAAGAMLRSEVDE